MSTVVSSGGLMTRKQAAEYLGLKYQTLACWAVSGKYGLKMIRVGRSVKYRKDDLDQWLERRTVGGGEAVE